MTLWFYEEDAPSLQRVTVNDTTGFNNNFASVIPTDSIPKATAAATSTTVPLNSWDDSLQNISSPNTGVNINLREEVATAVGQAFTAETLKGMYMKPGIGILSDATSFFPHTAHLYIRFKREQLQNVKKCQIQPQVSSGFAPNLSAARALLTLLTRPCPINSRSCPQPLIQQPVRPSRPFTHKVHEFGH